MTDPPHWKKENNWSRLQMGGSLCYTMGVILVKTSTGWPLFPWEISPYKTVTQTCGPIRGRRTLAAARPPRTYKHRLQRSICWYPHWTNEQHRLFKRRGACGKTNILKTWISMPFFFSFLHLVQNIQGRQLMWSFADKALRSPTGNGALFHRVPPGGTRPVWARGCRCDRQGGGRLKKERKKKALPCQWWTD